MTLRRLSHDPCGGLAEVLTLWAFLGATVVWNFPVLKEHDLAAPRTLGTDCRTVLIDANYEMVFRHS